MHGAFEAKETPIPLNPTNAQNGKRVFVDPNTLFIRFNWP
jgi:hypothetical protein